MNFKFYFSLFLRRLHWFLFFVALGSAAGLTLAKVLPPVYVAQAVLVVESEQIPDDLAASTVRTQAAEQLQIIEQRILTRERLLEMANTLDVYASADGRPAPQMTADDIVKDLRNRVDMNTTGEDSRSNDATLVTISFEASTAALSAAVANRLVAMILEENVSMRTGAARQTLDFFDQEVARLDGELAKQGAAILVFTESNLAALPDSLEFRRNQQAAAQERLLQFERDENALRDRRDRMVLLYGQSGELAALPTAQTTPEQRQLRSQREELANLLAILSPENPRVALLKAQVAAAEGVVARQMAGVSAVEGGEALTPYELQLADLDGQLDYLKVQKDQVEATMATLNTSIEATPGNAITLGALERDYQNLRTQYDQAVANRARAETGSLIENLAKGQRISVIEQAIAPRKPTRPKRLLILAGGIGAGLFLGLSFVGLLELMNSAIRRPVELTNRLGVIPLGTLPYLRSASQARRRKIILILAFLLVIGAIPAGLWFVDTRIVPLDQLIDRISGKLGISSILPSISTAVS